MNAVPGARTQTTLPLSPPKSNMAPPSEDNGKVKKDITKLPWRYCKWYVIMFGLWLFECFTPPPFKCLFVICVVFILSGTPINHLHSLFVHYLYTICVVFILSGTPINHLHSLFVHYLYTICVVFILSGTPINHLHSLFVHNFFNSFF